jgi:tetratricopeptide (TPR) repeat protein
VLELPEYELQDDAKRKQAVVRWLVDHPGWYLLIDNVDTREGVDAVTKLLHELRGGQIVITSRLAGWSNLVETLKLDVLTHGAAASLLLDASPDRSKQPDDEVRALALAKEVDGLALAVTQAAGYVNKYRITLAEYSDRFHSKTTEVLEWYDEKRMNYPRSIAITWNTTIEQISQPARTLLEMLSWLSTEPIPRELVTHSGVLGAWREAGVKKPEEALVELADVSLLHLEGGSFRIHRLVQEITRERCDERKDSASLVAMLEVVNRYPMGDPTDVRSWHLWEPLVAHVAAAGDRGDAHSIGTPTTRLMNQAALYWKQRIRFPEAERIFRRAIAIDERTLGPDHPQMAIGLSNLASLLYARNRLAEAEPLMRRMLAIGEQSLGLDHPNVATGLNNLAQLFKATNRFAEAEPLMRRALAIDERSFGPDHPNFSRDLNNLALLLQATNRLAEAEPLMRRALAIDEQSFGPDHPEVATGLSNLASLLQAANRLAEAEPLMRRALAIDERSFGSNHPNVAIRLSNLASLLYATNRLAEAEPLMWRALEIDERSFGPEHPGVATDLGNLAQLLQATNRLAEAESLIRRALAINERSFGPDHPDVASQLNNLASLLYATNRLAEAEPLIRRALEIDERSLGPDHPNVATRLNNLAQLLKATNRLVEAEPLMRRSLAIDERSFGPDHPNVAIWLSNLAHLLHATNRGAEAEPVTARAAEICLKFHAATGHEHQYHRTVIGN